MSFPRYGRYKDSGIEWLGEVPEHWHVAPLYSLGRERQESNGGLISNNLLSLSYGRIIRKDIETSDGLLPESFETYQIVHPGDIIFRLTDLQNDKRSLRTAIVEHLGIITFAYAAFEPRAIMAAYLNYLLRDYDLRKIFYSMGGGVRQSMKFDDIKRLPTLLPSKDEQSAIVKFLDQETSKINELIEQQRRLIELLKEKRDAAVSRAVTKGLAPNVQLKDSGVQSIGFIPSHWKSGPLKRFSKIVDCKHFTVEFVEIGKPIVSIRELRNDRIDLSEAKLAKEDDWKFLREDRIPMNGDLIICRNASVGAVGEVMPGMDFCMGQDVCLVRPAKPSGFDFYMLTSLSVRRQIDALLVGATIRRLNVEAIRNLVVTSPPTHESIAIAQQLRAENCTFENLIKEAVSAIDLLQERRSALISSTVTGKIDVRGYMGKPVMNATQYSSGFAHQLLAAEILDRCNSQRMGRIKLQKLIHLCEYHGQVSEVQGDYSRKAACPFDARAMAGISKNLKKQKWFEEVKEGERYVYRPLEKRGEHKKYLVHWQSEMPRIDKVLSLLGNFRTRECEIISTLYAAWNDLLIDGGPTDDAAILHEASSAERWHKSKEQIAPERWTMALEWMKEKGLVPVGYGKHTRHTAGQIGTTSEEAHEPA